MRKLNYTKALVIVHGKSEKQICQYIKNKLRLKIEIYSDKNGEKAIQITSLKNTLNNKIFKSYRNFINTFEDIELDASSKNINNNFKIFIIMDTDDCSEDEKRKFINKEMFKGHWAYDYIVPIYNIPELETVLTEAKVPFTKTGVKRKKEYIKLFPTDPKYIKTDEVQIKELLNKLKKQKNTNLNDFLDFCLKVSD
ncbi:MAG TPA: hypothetical protein IAB38_04840 [Candidatus Onthousia excrementipullorum]|uniref:Uncharacterized protein n=1 Tax=Candidatus Onthousia excrementipullorum TaxID=2840884 RepID=A0A9D1DUW4_9FIRM|nr:hypothetical protein [Candidatus Onthousia excrementipullorum]